VDLLQRAVVAGDVSLARWGEIAPTTPARMVGLYPRKGVIAPGADADVVVYDPNATQTISAETHHMNGDYSAYEGMQITGKVDTVFSRGSKVIADGAFHGREGHGTFLSRELSQYLL